MGKNQEYASCYAADAMEQMKRYGIPASVILAQGIIESSNGQSELAQKGNNHFGIKCTEGWLKGGGDYLIYTDDKPNEKFCRYDSVGESYRHHSEFLRNNGRYSSLFKLSPDDYKGWTAGLQQKGYATGKDYALNLQRVIEANGLDKYDKQVMQEMKRSGQSFGVVSKETSSEKAVNVEENNKEKAYAFPLQRKDFLWVTSAFGMRKDPMDSGKQQMHKGIDIRADHDQLFATENQGKVVAVNHDADSAGGRSVTLEYDRPDGGHVDVTYSHLESVKVSKGDVCKAGDVIGISGNSGKRTTGPHLHLSVKSVGPDGASRDIDPASYLAEIAVKGKISQSLMCNGENLLAKYQSEEKSSNMKNLETAKNLSPDEWMKTLLSSEDSGMSVGGDPILQLVMTVFSGLMALALQIDNRDNEEKLQAVSDGVMNRQIDLKSLVKNAQECSLQVTDGGKFLLLANLNGQSVHYELTAAEVSNLSSILHNEQMGDDEKQQRVTGLVKGLLLSRQASQNFEQMKDEACTNSLGFNR